MTQELMESPTQLPARQNGELAQVQVLTTVRDDGEFASLLDAGRFGHMQRVATLFANSQLVPQHFQGNVANCFIAMQMAIRMRVDPFMFMQNTYIVYGRPGMEAKLAISLINTSGLFTDSLDYEVVGEDPSAAGYKVRAFATRKTTGKTVHGPWVDWKLVKAEEWHSKKGSKWQTMPGLMFQYRAATFFGRLHCPERLMGMQTVEELRDVGRLADESAPAPVSRTESVLAKVTSRPVSENQTLEPAADVLDQIRRQTAETEQPRTTAPQTDVQEEQVEIPDPPFTYAEFVERGNGFCIDHKIEPGPFTKATAAAVLATGKKGKEDKIDDATIALWWRLLYENKGAFQLRR